MLGAKHTDGADSIFSSQETEEKPAEVAPIAEIPVNCVNVDDA